MSQEYFIPASPANDEEIHAYYHARIEQPMNNYHYPTNHMQSPTTTSDAYASTSFNNSSTSQYEQAQLWSPGDTASSPYSPHISHSSSSIPSLYAHPSQQPHLTVSTNVYPSPYERSWPPSATDYTSPPSSAPPETPESALAQWNATQQALLLPSGHQWPGDVRQSLATEGFLQEEFPAGLSPPTAPDMKKKTVASSSVQAVAEKKRKKEATFICSICSASLTAKHNLIHHENSHKGLKNFQCSYCRSEFAHGRSKSRHEQNSCPRRPGV